MASTTTRCLCTGRNSASQHQESASPRAAAPPAASSARLSRASLLGSRLRSPELRAGSPAEWAGPLDGPSVVRWYWWRMWRPQGRARVSGIPRAEHLPRLIGGTAFLPPSFSAAAGPLPFAAPIAARRRSSVRAAETKRSRLTIVLALSPAFLPVSALARRPSSAPAARQARASR